MGTVVSIICMLASFVVAEAAKERRFEVARKAAMTPRKAKPAPKQEGKEAGDGGEDEV